MNKSYTVYVHTTPSGKRYVGITNRPLSYRWRHGEGYATQVFYRAVQKYGWENISHEVIATGLTKDEACEEEKELIDLLDTTNPEHGYNMTGGGENYVMTDAVKQKIANKLVGNTNSKGVVFTEERRKNISEALKGKRLPPEVVQKIAQKRREAYAAMSEEEKIAFAHKYGGRPIVQYTKSGDFVKRYESPFLAKKEYGQSIMACLSGRTKSAYGFVWKYKEKPNEQE